MWAVVVASATPAPRVTIPNVSSSRAPDLSSGMRRITPQRSVRQLSSSAATNRTPYRGKQHATQVPVTQHEAATPNDSTWWSDPDSGERRRVKLSKFRTLMLDQSYRPIAVVNWQRAVSMDWMSKVDVLEYWQGVSVASASSSFDLPAVMCVKGYVQKPKKRNRTVISRRNIFVRDQYMCQYCRSKEHLTIDHVVPVSKGGEFSWTNCVCACRDCNMKKGSKTLAQMGWVPIRPPREPSHHELAPLRLVSGTSMLEDVEPWKTYLLPWIKKSHASLSAGL